MTECLAQSDVKALGESARQRGLARPIGALQHYEASGADHPSVMIPLVAPFSMP